MLVWLPLGARPVYKQYKDMLPSADIQCTGEEANITQCNITLTTSNSSVSGAICSSKWLLVDNSL